MTAFFSLTRRAALALATAACLATPALAEGETYKVGSTPSGVPFTFLDVKTNEITGLMVDIVDAIAAQEGFEATVEATQWSALIPSLTGSKIDIIAAAMIVSEERAKVVTFTDPVYHYGEGLFVTKDDQTPYRTWDDLAGKVVGVQVGTRYYDGMTASGKFKEIKVYDTIADIMRDVSLGRIDAGIADYPIVAYQMAQSESNLRLVPEYEAQMAGDVALAVRQDATDLLATLNDGIAKIKDSGELDAIVKKWGLN